MLKHAMSMRVLMYIVLHVSDDRFVEDQRGLGGSGARTQPIPKIRCPLADLVRSIHG